MDLCVSWSSLSLSLSNFISFMEVLPGENAASQKIWGDELRLSVFGGWRVITFHSQKCQSGHLLNVGHSKNRSPCSEKVLDVKPPSPPLVGIAVLKKCNVGLLVFSIFF